eukprot:CAMPEP_0203675934 /NCGR_PEP_ID=MMETSP0090-20130426/22697_1 /ASSEMBLY_ACC=CAM_ASM_001088 /TAXON_ID=426623 /ORGANISM="Chaetoceros affinis, Strain CCMP159" /LENGTH=293 /DNA_ID=CAMNT_0050542305 /DNA_START=42 /DNA_END=920 /DNA_ORIENTATION=-
MIRTNGYRIFSALMIILCNQSMLAAAGLVLLSDIPTPSFVVDIDALPSKFHPESLPILHLPKFGTTLSPRKISHEKEGGVSDCKNAATLLKYEFGTDDDEGQKVGYLHSSVIRAREDASEDDEPVSTFLAEIDLTQSLCSFDNDDDDDGGTANNDKAKAHVVLGLNNHHVGSYYWARSAGMGSSMEAPGVLFGPASSSSSSAATNGMDKGIIRWERDGGPLECNSNDGKRSEWVNFLRVGDNIQLLPLCEQEAIMAFVNSFKITSKSEDESRIYGVSSKGRPLGSEPLVVCRW